ncbi:MAG: DUF1287 domain-containing protein [Sedimenticola sp.]
MHDYDVGNELPASNQIKDYAPGDIVLWILSGNSPHIGIVTDKISGLGVGVDCAVKRCIFHPS